MLLGHVLHWVFRIYISYPKTQNEIQQNGPRKGTLFNKKKSTGFLNVFYSNLIIHYEALLEFRVLFLKISNSMQTFH